MKNISRHFGLRREQKKIVEGRKIGIDFLSYENYNVDVEAYRQKASELLTSEEGLRHRGKRCIEPEAVFGQIKYNMAYRRFRHIGVDKVKMDFAFFAIAFNIKKMVAKMTKGGLFSYLRAYLTHITPYKLFIRLFFVEKQKLVVHPHKNVQRVSCYLYWEF